MSSPQIQFVLWLSQPVLQAIVVTVVFRRRLHKEFPAFFAYMVAQIGLFAVDFPAYLWGRPNVYFAVYYFSAALNVVFAFKIIHEVFLDVFRPYPALKDLGTALFKWSALIMILVSVVMISTNSSWDEPVTRTILVVQRCVDIVQCGMVIFLLAFCKSLGVSWKRQSFGIALGFGVMSAVELLTIALYSGLHLHGMTTSLINLVAFDASICLWLAYSVLNRRQALVPVLVPQRWDEALTDIQPHGSDESLIPMFEHMVDRAFSKAQDGRAGA